MNNDIFVVQMVDVNGRTAYAGKDLANTKNPEHVMSLEDARQKANSWRIVSNDPTNDVSLVTLAIIPADIKIDVTSDKCELVDLS